MSDSTTNRSISSSLKRSWRRFTLRALLLAVLAASVFFGWISYRVRQFHEQAVFIDDLRARGYTINVEPIEHNAWLWERMAGDAAVQVRMAQLFSHNPVTGGIIPPTHDDLQRIRDWKSIKYLDLYGPTVTDSSLELIGEMQQLRSLVLTETSVTDRGLTYLTPLRELRELRLSGYTWVRNAPNRGHRVEITDKGVNTIATLNLTTLSVSSYSITDEGLQVICTRLSRLTNLALNEVDITDAGLGALELLSSLADLKLIGDFGVTDAGVDSLKKVKSITRLSLKGTRITRTGAKSLVSTLPHISKDAESWRTVLGDFTLDEKPYRNPFDTHTEVTD